MKKITITNAYTYKNKGDAAILLGIVEALKRQYGENNIEINILSFTPEIDNEKYCTLKCIKKVYSNTLNPFPYKQTKLGKVKAVFKLFFRMIKLFLKSKISFKRLIEKEESLKVLSKSDLIIVCGGGFLGGKKYDSLMHVFQIYLDTLFNKPVIVMGTSIEPIKKKIIKRYTEKVLKKVDFIYAREKITYDYLKNVVEEDKLDLIPDMAFMIDEKPKKLELIENIRKNTNMVFGITARKWNFPNLKTSSKEAMENYKKAIFKMMINYIEKYNAYFVFVPQVIADTNNDTIIAKEIRGLITEEYKKNIVIIEDDLSPEELKTLIGNFDYFIGTRMHSNIFATSMRIPNIVIAYEKKTNGIMEIVGLEDYVLEIDTVTSDELISKIDKCINNKTKIINYLNTKIPELKQEILEKIDKVMKNY